VSLAVALAGWAAAGALLAAYALVSTGRLSGAGRPFQTLNLLGAAGLVLNSAEHRAWPSVALNAIWILIGLAALKTSPGRTKAAPLSEIETGRT
jgi:hypothetical protein